MYMQKRLVSSVVGFSTWGLNTKLRLQSRHSDTLSHSHALRRARLLTLTNPRYSSAESRERIVAVIVSLLEAVNQLLFLFIFMGLSTAQEEQQDRAIGANVE